VTEVIAIDLSQHLDAYRCVLSRTQHHWGLLGYRYHARETVQGLSEHPRRETRSGRIRGAGPDDDGG
ncbi:uncharacterized protein METZ01_LOCUS25250, partial [marine metagenome]